MRWWNLGEEMDVMRGFGLWARLGRWARLWTFGEVVNVGLRLWTLGEVLDVG